MAKKRPQRAKRNKARTAKTKTEKASVRPSAMLSPEVLDDVGFWLSRC